MMKTESLGSGTAKILYNNEDSHDIFSLSVEEVMELFKSFGLLLFRGFGVTLQQMKPFSEQFSSRYFIDYTKPSVEFDEFINFVDSGKDHIVVPHSEHAYSPFRPDVIWFYCSVPTEKGGETLFWDGVRVWEELSRESKQLFSSKKLKFCHHNIPPNLLKRFAGADDTIDVKTILDSLEGVTYQINEDLTISLEYHCSAVVKTKYGNQDAFANSFLVKQIKTQEATFEDGSRASSEVVDEIKKILDRLTQEIKWQSGDLVMIDNSKFLHARRVFNDDRRQIFTTLSNLKLVLPLS